MELSWSTFVLELINFLVLLWILKHFLYKPVLDVIAKRRAAIEKTRAEAEALHTDAEKLQEQYQSRLADWSRERQKARDDLAREIEAERARKISDMQSELQQEREKARVAEIRRESDALHKTEETALMQAATFATRLLEKSAGPEVEDRLAGMVIDELSRLSRDRVEEIRKSFEQTPGEIQVISAFPLSDHHRQGLEKAMTKLAGSDVVLRFGQDKGLLAGLRITVGAWVLSANLQDELKGMAELAHGQ